MRHEDTFSPTLFACFINDLANMINEPDAGVRFGESTKSIT